MTKSRRLILLLLSLLLALGLALPSAFAQRTGGRAGGRPGFGRAPTSTSPGRSVSSPPSPFFFPIPIPFFGPVGCGAGSFGGILFLVFLYFFLIRPRMAQQIRGRDEHERDDSSLYSLDIAM